MKKILLTGCSGFVGEEIVHKLSKKYIVLGLDNFDPPVSLNKFKNKNFLFFKQDISNNYKNLDNIFFKYKPEIIVHCASKILDTSNKREIWDTNFHATKDLLNLSIKYKLKKFIFTSTFSIYEKSYKHLIDESEPPSYKTIYGETKFKAENLIMKSNFNGDICILRCPIILGKRRLYRFGVLFSMIKDNFNIPLIGGGKNKLSFVYVEDVCGAIEKFFKCKGKYIFNIASNEKEEFQFIINRLIKKVNSKSKIRNINKTLGNILFDIVVFFKLVPYVSYHKKMFNYDVLLDTKKIKMILKWEPKYTNEKMFEENYKNFDKIINENKGSFSKKKAKEGLIKIAKYFF